MCIRDSALGLAYSYSGSLTTPVLPGPAWLLLPGPVPPEDDPRFQGTLFRWKSEGGNLGGPELKNPLVTDRPDFTESSVGVGWGVRQVEFGYTFTSSSSGGVRVRTQTAGEQLLRAGVHADWLEFRLGMVPGFLSDSIDGFDLSLPLVFEQTRTNGAASSTAGFPDLYTGFKVALFPQEGNLPEVADSPTEHSHRYGFFFFRQAGAGHQPGLWLGARRDLFHSRLDAGEPAIR